MPGLYIGNLCISGELSGELRRKDKLLAWKCVWGADTA